MSLVKTKTKETKGKKKMLPKLKAILANPNKTKCPILDEEEMDHLKILLQNAIKESELEPRSFAIQKGICLGLESSLRKINNQTSSCVFISLSIKPNHVIGLIARNAETKNELQPVYAQPKLENFIEEIFGVQALCMVFPKDLSAISGYINKWVQERKNPIKAIQEEVATKKTLKKIFKRAKMEEQNEIVKKECTTKSEKENKSWSGDFISFDEDNFKKDALKLDDDEAVEALSEIIEKIPSSKIVTTKTVSKSETMEVDIKEEAVGKKVEGAGDSDNSDDFLGEYKSLTVHKIKGNPNKKPKKKRNKNKKKNK